MQGFLSVPRLVHLSVYICKSVAGYCLSVRSHWFLSPLVTSRLYGTFAGVWGRVGRGGGGECGGGGGLIETANPKNGGLRNGNVCHFVERKKRKQNIHW